MTEVVKLPLPFKIFRVDAVEAQRITDSPDDPHRHDYEELIIAREGRLEHFIDFKSDIIEAPLVSFVTKGKIHRAIPRLSNGKCDMWVLRFSSEFIAETIFQLYISYHNSANLKLENGVCFNRLNTVCEMIDLEMKGPQADLAVVRHLLSALLIMIESERKKVATGDVSAGIAQNETFTRFLQILEENFRRPAGVEFYAEKLFMTSRNLNLICQSIVQQSVSEIIDTRKLIEAKNLLAGTNKTVSEIGFELGFNEKAYFTNVFRKKAGQTPTEFRREMKALVQSD